jgi:integrase
VSGGFAPAWRGSQRGRQLFELDLIDGGNVDDEETNTTKTSKSRIILLSAPALVALQRQKARTLLQGAHVFHDPTTDEPWKYQTIADLRCF